MFGINLTRTLCTLSLIRFCHIEAANFYSRNFPRDCTYVFAVDSELRWNFDSEDFENENSFMTQVYSEYEERWINFEEVELKDLGNGKSSAELYLNSMSTNPRFLYRKIRYQTRRGKFETEFGRQFGEKCFPYKDPLAPFIEREIISVSG